MNISVPKEGITGLLGRLLEKIFNENSSISSAEHEIFKVRYNKRISGQLRNIVYCGLLSQEKYCGLERTLAEKDKHLTVKDRLCVLGYNFKAVGLLDKFSRLEKMVSKLDFTSTKSSPFTGDLDAIHEVEAVLKVLLALSNNSKMMTQDPCEVWRKVDSSSQSITAVQTDPSPFHSDMPKVTPPTSQFSLDYQYYPSELFEAVPCFGVPKRGFEKEDISLSLNIFSQEPGSCGLTKWFGVQRNKDSFCKKTRTTLYNALIYSQTHDFEVKLSLPDLSLHSDHRLYSKPLETPMISEDEGFVEVSDESEQSTIPALSDDDTVIQNLDVWDEALKQKPSCFHTWEGRKQIGFKSCKPFITEAGPDVIDCVYDMRMKEASFLINAPSAAFKYLDMKELVRDGLMALIGVPSQTFQLEKSTTSFLISPRIRLSGCSPDSLHHSLQGLADIGTNYLRLSKFMSYQKHSTIVQSSVLRAYIGGLRKYFQKYREAVIMVEAPHAQSVLELSMKFRKQAHELKFLSDICMCPQAFAGAVGKPKPKFPVGVKLLSYLYQLCLINASSPVANLLLFLLKVSCTPYLRFVQQWVFKGRCTDVYKEFMINKNDIYLANRDKHYWNSGYTMTSNTKMEGVPVFLKDLADDMFTCGKSINLLKLCFPAHYICNHEVGVPVMNVVYSLDSLKVVCESSRRYCDKMRKLEQQKKLDWERKKNEEKLRREQVLILKREKANKALADVKELVQKAKKALAEKKKEELDFLKKQMEDALNRKLLEVKKVDEEDARITRDSSLYEVTTAKLEEQLKEEAREELIRYYDELTRVAERREKHALWLARRHALNNEREKFLETETNKLEELRKEMKDKINEADEREGAAIGVTRRQWVINTEPLNTIIESQDGIDGMILNQASQSTVQNLIYNTSSKSAESHTRNSEKTLAISGREFKRAVRNSTESTIQNLIYPTAEPGFTSEKIKNRATSGIESLTGTSGTGDFLSLSRTKSTSVDFSRSMTQGSSPDDQKGTDASTSKLRVTPKSTRGNQPSSTVEHLMYPSGDTASNTTKLSRRGELPSTVEHLLYPSEDTASNTTKLSRRGELPSTVEHLLYPSEDTPSNTTTSSRRSEPPSTVEHLIYPSDDTSNVTQKSSRGSEPPSTIQMLLYPAPSATQEPEIRKREPLTHEDVWLATEFESYPDNFDILNEKPFGDIFARVFPDREGLCDDFYACETENEDLESENVACNVLCLPVILQRCVMEPLIAQINVVNSAIVRYFMDDLKLIEHFETLKKFLLMEDGEFSFSLTQQLSEKVSSGVTPQQLCCISTLNYIMAHAIQSSVYACQSENTRSLSFVLKSLPDIFKRNHIGIFDFIELRYKIQWPVNIVITENCITKYNRIFAFMLRLKRISWVLQDIRYSLKRVDKSGNNSPQLRKVHLFRHEMSHFVNDVQGYISNQILHVTWQEFVQSLNQNVRNLDDLHDCHADYLNKALFRALLNKKAAPVMKIISDLFTMVLKFRTQLVSSSWFADPASGHLVHPRFSLLCATHESFKESTCFLLTVISKLITRGYQPHLEELLLRLDFNSYYGKE